MVLILKRKRQVTEIYKKIVPGGGEYLDKEKPGNILISDKTAEILKLKQYIITQEILDKLKAENVPDNILSNLSNIKRCQIPISKRFQRGFESLN